MWAITFSDVSLVATGMGMAPLLSLSELATTISDDVDIATAAITGVA